MGEQSAVSSQQSATTNGNDPVNSRAGFYHDDAVHDHGDPGITKREYFAATILQGIVASRHNVNYVSEKIFAAQAVRQADALIDALNKESK